MCLQKQQVKLLTKSTKVTAFSGSNFNYSYIEGFSSIVKVNFLT